MLRKIPHEVTASLLAATTAFIGAGALHLPPWAIFIGWAGTYLAGGANPTVMKSMWIAMPAGSTFALVIVLILQHWGASFGHGTWAMAAFQALVILIVNTALMYTGRIKLFSLVPAMFLGFASMFATCFGGFGPKPGNAWVAWIATITMNFLGPVFAWIADKLNTQPSHH